MQIGATFMHVRLSMPAYACVCFQIAEGRAETNTNRESRMFPDNKDSITCHDLTRDFLIYATDVTIFCTATVVVSTSLLSSMSCVFFVIVIA